MSRKSPRSSRNRRSIDALEPGCRRFEVWTNSDRPATLFLYEVYDDRPAFDAHLATDHFGRFDLAVAWRLTSTTVRFWERVL